MIFYCLSFFCGQSLSIIFWSLDRISTTLICISISNTEPRYSASSRSISASTISLSSTYDAISFAVWAWLWCGRYMYWIYLRRRSAACCSNPWAPGIGRSQRIFFLIFFCLYFPCKNRVAQKRIKRLMTIVKESIKRCMEKSPIHRIGATWMRNSSGIIKKSMSSYYRKTYSVKTYYIYTHGAKNLRI